MTLIRLAPWLLALPLVAHAAPASLATLAPIAVGGEARWDYATIASDAHRLYLAHATQVDVVDTLTGKLVGTVPGTAGVHGVAIAADLGLGFASDGRADAVTVFDLATLEPRATIPVGHGPDAILYDAASHRVMTFNAKSRDVTLIDAATYTVVATVPAGGKPEFAERGAGGRVWFNVEDTGEIAVLDPVEARIVQRIPLAPCEGPSGLAYDGRANHYAVCENRQMAVVDAHGHVIARPAIGAGPDGVVWMDGAAWSANGRDGTISVVRETSPAHFETVETIPTAAGARTIAADPATHRLYLPAAKLEPAVDGERRKGVPGSFHVIVLEKR
jgi:YVTN family beta-propeller protein